MASRCPPSLALQDALFQLYSCRLCEVNLGEGFTDDRVVPACPERTVDDSVQHKTMDHGLTSSANKEYATDQEPSYKPCFEET